MSNVEVQRGANPQAGTRDFAEALAAFGGARPFRCATQALVASASA